MSRARNLDYVMHFKEWDLVHLIKKLEDDETSTGMRLLRRAERILDSTVD